MIASNWQTFRWNFNYAGRGVVRGIVSLVVLSPLAACIEALLDTQEENKAAWLAGAVVSAALLAFVLRWFAEGRGILVGFWLALLSVGVVNGVVAVAVSIMQLAVWPDELPLDPSEILPPAIIGVALLFLCNWGLSRSDLHAGRS